MATTRNLWRLTYDQPEVEDRFTSQVRAYNFIWALARGDEGGSVTVWVDERDGHGWQLYERINLADYGTGKAP